MANIDLNNNKMKYAIFVSRDKHFELNDPDKFKEKIKEIAEKNNENYLEILKYYLARHNLVEEELILRNENSSNELNEAGNRMKKILEKWIN